MNGETSFHFSEASDAPAPWRFFDASGRRVSRVDAGFTVYRIRTGTRGQAARSNVRSFLSVELRRIAGRAVTLRESAAGPEVPELVRGGKISISISYLNAEAWLALGWDGPLGIDAVAVEQIPEWEQVATTYLGATASERLRTSSERAADFAAEWASFEARLKMHGLSLREGVEVPPTALCTARFGTAVVAVAMRAGSVRMPRRSDSPSPAPNCCFAP